MKVLIISSEMAPMAQETGRGAWTSTLAKQLRGAGHDVVSFLPRYKWLGKKTDVISPFVRRIRLRMGVGTKEFNIYSCDIASDLGDVYLIDKDLYFKRDDIYGSDSGFHADHFERFEYFALSVLEGLKVVNYQPDVVIAVGSEIACVPVFLTHQLMDQSFYKDMKSIFVRDGIRDESCDVATFKALSLSQFFPNESQPVMLGEIGTRYAHESVVLPAGATQVDGVVQKLATVGAALA